MIPAGKCQRQDVFVQMTRVAYLTLNSYAITKGGTLFSPGRWIKRNGHPDALKQSGCKC